MRKLSVVLFCWVACCVGGLFGQMNDDTFIIGSNFSGETGPTYLAAEFCAVPTPTPSTDIGFTTFHAIIIANGVDDSGPLRLSQNEVEDEVIDFNSVFCGSTPTTHTGTSFYRQFEVDLQGDLQLNSVEVGLQTAVENATGLGSDDDGLVPFQICLYYDTPVTEIVHSSVNGPSGFDATFCAAAAGDFSQDLSVLTIPIDAVVPAGTTSVVVEIFTPGTDTDPATDFCLNSAGCEFAIGDVNQDGSIDLFDVSPFVTAITGDFVCEADINEDGLVDLFDVSPFVTILTGGG